MLKIVSCILITITLTIVSVVSVIPTIKPTATPSVRPSRPTGQPTGEPTVKPTGQPTSEPTTFKPSRKPTVIPTSQPSKTSSSPTFNPSKKPTSTPTIKPSSPTFQPTFQPSFSPSSSPSIVPTAPTSVPSKRPTRSPTNVPSHQPVFPTSMPTVKPTFIPTFKPSAKPTYSPTSRPTATPVTIQPTISSPPTRTPTYQPSVKPSKVPTSQPTAEPSFSQEPTGQPTSIPTRKPTSQPSVKPSLLPTYVPTRSPSKPTVTPSRIPTVNPTFIPSASPSVDPSALPTSDPTCVPTFAPSTPTVTPTARPTSLPIISTVQPSTPTVVPSYKPSRTPVYKPTVRPSAPTYSPSLLSAYPTSIYNLANLTGSIQFDPVHTGLCQTAEIHITLQVSRVIHLGDVIRILTPGLTTGPCSQPSSGDNIALMNLWNSSQFIGTYVEGNVSYGFRDSYFEFSVNIPSGLQVNEKYFITVDRINGFKRSCSSNYTAWSVLIGRCNKMKHCKNYEMFGALAVTGPLATSAGSDTSGMSQCFAYSSSLFLSPAEPHMVHTINLQFSFPFPLQAENQIIVYLPGLTIRNRYRNITDITNDYTATSSSSSSLLLLNNGSRVIRLTEGIEWTSFFDWLVYWEEGDSNPLSINTTNTNDNDDDDDDDGFKYKYHNSKLILIPIDTGILQKGTILLDKYNNISTIYISISRFPNAISSLYGQPTNTSDFMYEVLSSSSSSSSSSVQKSNYYISKTSFDSTNQIGSGCSQLNNCNNHGKCHYQKDTCLCYDGYGSVKDQKYAVSNDFLLDCSSLTCPLGPASVSVPLPPLVTTGLSGNNNNINMTISNNNLHRLIECSNNGLCNRNKGLCQCFTGYEGPACQRRTCPVSASGNICSGRGMCMNIQNLAKYSTAMPLTYSRYRYEHADDTGATGASGTTTISSRQLRRTLGWDENLNHACVCDSAWAVGLESGETQQAEYFGVACEKRHCPSGDDPNTRFIDETNCTGINVYYQNNILLHTTNTSSSSNINNMADGAVSYDVGKVGNRCHVDCSNNGLCDYATGICACYAGHTGSNCGLRLGYAAAATTTS